MEGYRSYSEPPGYPEGRPPYPESRAPEPDYGDNAGWYGDRAPREPGRYEETSRYEETQRYDERSPLGPERYDEQRREPPRPGPADPSRVGSAAPRPTPAGAPTVDDPPSAPRRPAVAPGSPGPGGDSLYRSRRPGVAALFWGPAAILELPALLLLVAAGFADPPAASGVTAAICLMVALPLMAAGLYAVATGAVRAAGPNSVQAWLRPPVAYLTVAVFLFIAAGLAA